MNKRYAEIVITREYNQFLKNLKNVYDSYNEHIKPIYNNPTKIADNYREQLVENPDMLETFCETQEAFYWKIEELTYEKYDIANTMNYRYIAMHLILMYEMLEQFFSKIILTHFNCTCDDKEFLEKYKKGEFYNIGYFQNMIEILGQYDYKYKQDDNYIRLEEYGLLYNTLKHGEGKSLKNLQRKFPKYFEQGQSKSNYFPMYQNTLIDVSLNISEKEVDEFYNLIKNFICGLPKHYKREYYLKG